MIHDEANSRVTAARDFCKRTNSSKNRFQENFVLDLGTSKECLLSIEDFQESAVGKEFVLLFNRESRTRIQKYPLFHKNGETLALWDLLMSFQEAVRREHVDAVLKKYSGNFDNDISLSSSVVDEENDDDTDGDEWETFYNMELRGNVLVTTKESDSSPKSDFRYDTHEENYYKDAVNDGAEDDVSGETFVSYEHMFRSLMESYRFLLINIPKSDIDVPSPSIIRPTLPRSPSRSLPLPSRAVCASPRVDNIPISNKTCRYILDPEAYELRRLLQQPLELRTQLKKTTSLRRVLIEHVFQRLFRSGQQLTTEDEVFFRDTEDEADDEAEEETADTISTEEEDEVTEDEKEENTSVPTTPLPVSKRLTRSQTRNSPSILLTEPLASTPSGRKRQQQRGTPVFPLVVPRTPRSPRVLLEPLTPEQIVSAQKTTVGASKLESGPTSEIQGNDVDWCLPSLNTIEENQDNIGHCIPSSSNVAEIECSSSPPFLSAVEEVCIAEADSTTSMGDYRSKKIGEEHREQSVTQKDENQIVGVAAGTEKWSRRRGRKYLDHNFDFASTEGVFRIQFDATDYHNRSNVVGEDVVEESANSICPNSLQELVGNRARTEFQEPTVTSMRDSPKKGFQVESVSLKLSPNVSSPYRRRPMVSQKKISPGGGETPTKRTKNEVLHDNQVQSGIEVEEMMSGQMTTAPQFKKISGSPNVSRKEDKLLIRRMLDVARSDDEREQHTEEDVLETVGPYVPLRLGLHESSLSDVSDLSDISSDEDLIPAASTEVEKWEPLPNRTDIEFSVLSLIPTARDWGMDDDIRLSRHKSLSALNLSAAISSSPRCSRRHLSLIRPEDFRSPKESHTLSMWEIIKKRTFYKKICKMLGGESEHQQGSSK